MIQHEFAEVNGVKLHYAFNGKGKMIMFLHGYPEYWEMWKPQLNDFGKNYFAVAPDMRGYNLSSAPSDPKLYTQKILAEDIRQLVEHLGQKKITLVAHDWGGGVAWTFALLFPQYLERLVIINSPHPATLERELRNNPEQRKASSYMLFFRSSEAEKILSENNYSSLLNLAFSDLIKNGVLSEEDIKGYISAWSQPGALTGGLNYYRAASVEALENLEEALKKPPFGDLIPKITVPTLVIWGEKDTALLINNLDGLEKYVPGVIIKKVPDASHWVVREKPDLVTRYIREFIGG
jgi:epoxide hydrolase 4